MTKVKRLGCANGMGLNEKGGRGKKSEKGWYKNKTQEKELQKNHQRVCLVGRRNGKQKLWRGKRVMNTTG